MTERFRAARTWRWLTALVTGLALLAGTAVSQTSPQTSAETSGGTSQASPPSTLAPAKLKRWYNAEQVENGQGHFALYCAVCHGKTGEGAPNWRERDENGKFRPPPLDGTGHTWHHPFQHLGAQIKFGSREGQSMPRFEGTLSDQQIVETIAYFQSLWTDEIYAQWLQLMQRQRQ